MTHFIRCKEILLLFLFDLFFYLQGRALPPTVNEEPLTSLEWDEEDMSYPDQGLEDSGVANDLVLGACAANTSPVHESVVSLYTFVVKQQIYFLDIRS